MGIYTKMIENHGDVMREMMIAHPNKTFRELAKFMDANKLLSKPNGKGFYSFKSIENALSTIRPPEHSHDSVQADMAANREIAIQAFKMPDREMNLTLPDDDLDMSDMPFPDGEWITRKPYIIKGKRALVMSDIHLGHHVNGVLKLAIDSAKDFKIDTIILNGDTLELDRISRWQSKPDAQTLKQEIDLGRNLLRWLRSLFPDVEIVWHDGNHDVRVEAYILSKAPDLYGLGIHTLPELLDMHKYNVNYVDQFTHMRLGELNIMHGHLLKGGGVNVAQTKFKNANCNLLFGHLHVVQEYTTRDLNGKIKGAWATGCLSTLSPEFSPINSWNWGFALIERDDDYFTVHNYKVIEDKGKFRIL